MFVLVNLVIIVVVVRKNVCITAIMAITVSASIITLQGGDSLIVADQGYKKECWMGGVRNNETETNKYILALTFSIIQSYILSPMLLERHWVIVQRLS